MADDGTLTNDDGQTVEADATPFDPLDTILGPDLRAAVAAAGYAIVPIKGEAFETAWKKVEQDAGLPSFLDGSARKAFVEFVSQFAK